MWLERHKVIHIYPNFEVTFDPIFTYTIIPQLGIFEIGIKNNWSIGMLWGYAIGSYSTYRLKWLKIGKLTVYIHFGITEPHNPYDRRPKPLDTRP